MSAGNGIEEAALARTWRHAHEEDDGDRLVFRPPEVELPPARGRTGFALSSDGTMHHIGIARDDRRSFTPGTWKVDGRTLTLRAPGGDVIYEIVSVDDQRLVLRRV